jgi:broad specificity phosphatase PhoE
MMADGSSNRASRRLWLVRHASTAWTGRRFCGRTDLSLSNAGRAEAMALADRLAAHVPDGVLIASSPARRARETADVLHASVRGDGHVEIDNRLREVDFGQAEGLTFDRLAETMPDLASALATGDPVDWPDGESAAALRARAADVWADLRDSTEPGLLVTHGGFIRALLGVALGRPALPNAWIQPGAVFELGGAATQWELVSVRSATEGIAT